VKRAAQAENKSLAEFVRNAVELRLERPPSRAGATDYFGPGGGMGGYA
jgi:hypothetical protein